MTVLAPGGDAVTPLTPGSLAGVVAMIDNYDSFTYNLVQYLGGAGATVRVVRNDAVSADALLAAAPAAVVISPGPGEPGDAGISRELVLRCAGVIPLLGVCLGHQAIGQAFGGHVIRAPRVMHGKVSQVYHDGTGVMRGLPMPFRAARYHSLIVERASLPEVLRVTAWTEDGLIMGLRHREVHIEGVQFHPESIATEHGHRLLEHFLAEARVPLHPGAAA